MDLTAVAFVFMLILRIEPDELPLLYPALNCIIHPSASLVKSTLLWVWIYRAEEQFPPLLPIGKRFLLLKAMDL